MKKFYLLFTAMLALFVTTAKADRILFSENYEAGGVPKTWTINGGTGSIAGDAEGKYFSFALGQNNGRSAHCLWGESIFDPVKEGLTEYAVSIDFQYQAFGNNQYNGEFAVFSGEKCIKTNGNSSGNWSPYCTITPDCLFDMNESEDAIKAMDTKDPTLWYLNGDVDNSFNLTAGTWYTLVLNVNVATREVSFTIDDLDGTFHKAGSKTLAEDANIYASGLYLMNARYQSVVNIDNVKVTVPGDFANIPVIALTGLNMAERTYTITFMEGETLHVTTTDGSEKVVGYYETGDVPGAYVITTSTSGKITAYTTAGTMQSEQVSVDVVCETINLEGVVKYGIIEAEEGFAKTYQFTIDNSKIEMQPEIFMDFNFKSEDGQHDLTLTNQNSGVSVKVSSKGTLTVTTKALGYGPGTTTIENDKEFIIKYDIDFQKVTGEQLLEKGFEKMDDLNSVTMSGESNWTGRMRMYYKIATGEKDEEGNDIYNNYAVYGFNENAENYEATVAGYVGKGLDNPVRQLVEYKGDPIQRYRFVQSKLTQEAATSLFAPMYLWYGTTGIDKTTGWDIAEDGTYTAKVDANGNPGGTTNVKIYEGIGLVHSGILGDDEKYDPANKGYGNIIISNVTLGVDGLTDKDLIVVSKIDNYGGGSVHPEFPVGTNPETAKAEYKNNTHLGAVNSTVKGTETFQLVNTNTALNRVLVLTEKNGTGIEELPYNKVVSDHNAPIYNLNGVQVSPNALKKGLYIKQGKKFVVR